MVSMFFGKLFCWNILLGLTDKNHSKTQDTFIAECYLLRFFAFRQVI